MSTERSVIVLGGGVAGITAALDCAEAGARVRLLEVRPRLGGAAYSFEREGMQLDNGQHVFLRCCEAYRRFLERIGSLHLTKLQERLDIPVLGPGRARPLSLRRNGLPAPLHLAGALLGYSRLRPVQRVRAGLAAFALGRLEQEDALARESRDGATLGRWLAEHGQGAESIAALWDLIALPTLNVGAEEGSLALGAFVLRTGLLERSDAGDIGFHMHPLSTTIGSPSERALQRAGVQVRLATRARQIQVERDGVSVQTGEERLRADTVICAIQHERAADLLEPLLGERVADWRKLGSSPIVNVHVVYDRRVCDLQFAAGIDTPVQYVFDRSSAVGLREGDGQYLAISLSGATREMGDSNERLRERYLAALADLFPRARQASVRSFHVSREHAATFKASPGVGALRPAARTDVPGVLLAGAWTDTGWPATLEGAVLSGHAAAREALRS